MALEAKQTRKGILQSSKIQEQKVNYITGSHRERRQASLSGAWWLAGRLRVTIRLALKSTRGRTQDTSLCWEQGVRCWAWRICKQICCRGAGLHLIALYHLSHQGSPPSTFILSCEKLQQGVFSKDMFSADKVCGQCSKVS